MALTVQTLADDDGVSELYVSANKVAQVVVSQVCPDSILLGDRAARMATMNKVFEEADSG